MKSETLERIRTECTTPRDLLELLGSVQWRFPPDEPIGDAIGQLCGLIETDYDTPEPTLDDLPAQRADWKRRSDSEAAYELQRGMLDTHQSMMAVMRGYP